MAIRMRPDENSGHDDRPRVPNGPQEPRRGSGGGLGMLSMFLPMLLNIFRKNPKMGLMLVAAAALFYFGSGMFSGEGGTADNPNIVSPYQQSLGFNHDAVKYGNTAVYEPLADNRKNPLPEKKSLLEYAPKRLNQGRQGSCVGWAGSYAARSILHARQTGEKVPFSPSYLYNQVALEGCQGAYFPDALEVMKKRGLLPEDYFRYDESSCSKRPSSKEAQAAANFRIKDYQRLTKGRSSGQKVDILGIKQNLAAGAPVVTGVLVGGSFMRNMEGKDKWIPTKSDYNMNGFGGHAMCIIGYDDYKFGPNQGGLQIMNSWGENWGNKGVCWMSYQDFEYFSREAYGLYPMGSSEQENQVFAARFGLVKNKGKVNVAFKQTGENTFRTVTPMKKDEDFKIEVTNTQDCYTYVFGQETDGTIYTLFPYNKKHSPFCGTKGTRLFPRFESLYPDNEGNLDYMGVILSKQVIDYEQAQQALNQASGTMAQKMKAVLGNNLLDGMEFQAGKSIEMGTRSSKEGASYIVMEIDKQ